MSNVKMLIDELKSQGITHPAVLEAIFHTPREQFVLPSFKKRAYDNSALPIEAHQTISQPYIVGLMSQALFEHPNPQKILEIGTGSGYQAAILARLFKQVWTVERIQKLYLHAKDTLTKLGFNNIHFKLDDGSLGWEEEAPFDGILVTAAANSAPPKLIEQLNPSGGLMVIPLGAPHYVQQLTVIRRNGDLIEETILEQVCFVPLIEGVD